MTKEEFIEICKGLWPRYYDFVDQDYRKPFLDLFTVVIYAADHIEATFRREINNFHYEEVYSLIYDGSSIMFKHNETMPIWERK